MDIFWILFLCSCLIQAEQALAEQLTPPQLWKIDGDSKDRSQSPEEFITTHSNHRLTRDFILSLYNNLTKGISLNQATGRPKHWREVSFADTVRSFPAIASHELRQQLVYRFNISQINPRERLRVAELRVKFPSTWNLGNLNVVAVASKGTELIYASSIPIATAHVGTDEFGIIDITSAVQDWLEFVHFRKLERDTTLDLAFSVISRRKGMTRTKLLRQLERFYENEMQGDASPPLDAILVTYTESGGFLGGSESHHRESRDAVELQSTVTPESAITEPESKTSLRSTFNSIFNNKTRMRRSSKRTNASTSQEKQSPCRRKNLEIDFPALGWGEWVVYPTQFNAFQCTGTCGGFADSQNNPTNHAIVQSLVKLVSNSNIPISCCTPTKLLPLSILYLEKGSVVIKHHEEMIVDECGCM